MKNASSGMLRCMALVGTDISEERSATIIRVTRIGELGTTVEVTSDRRTLVGWSQSQYSSSGEDKMSAPAGNGTTVHRLSSLYLSRYIDWSDRLCGLMVTVTGSRSRNPGFDSWRYQSF
jgi:hypothetical protein